MRLRMLAISAGLGLSCLFGALSAFAQGMGPSPAAPAGGSSSPNAGIVVTPGASGGAVSYGGYGYGAADASGNGAGAGDTGAGAGPAGAPAGAGPSSAILPEDEAAPIELPAVHLVRRGETLWDLCNQYYGSPWEWPRIWSYNSQITNPHWIYPGDQIRMRSADEPQTPVTARRKSFSIGGAPGAALFRQQPRVAKSTIFLRDQGYLGDPDRDVWGELVGALEEQMMLAEGNHAYLTIRPGVDLKIGQELTIFKSVRQPGDVPGARRPPGQIVAIKGTIKIDEWNPETRVARGEIIESLDAIERGAKVGPLGRRFDVLPAVKSDANVEARVLTSLYPYVYIAQNQITFLDRGSEDGLKPGNTLYVLRKGDTWRSTLATASNMARSSVRIDSPDPADVEVTPLRGDPRKFPEEIVAELRVLRTEKYSSIALVTRSRREVVSGDLAVSRIGE